MSAERTFHLHLVSDSTGETVSAVARACLAQFDQLKVTEHMWPLVRTGKQIERVAAAVVANPGPVIYTLIDPQLGQFLQGACREINVPCVSVIDPTLNALSVHFDSKRGVAPGRQHVLDAEYFRRIDAMHYTLAHDDGQGLHDIDEADVILVGPSRTSKTPTCVYLANRGVKAANVPLVPHVPAPAELEAAQRPLVVGLVTDPERLVQIRRNRLRAMMETAADEGGNYTDPELVSEEMRSARRLYQRQRWPTIDVTRRSIEETAATILRMLTERRESRSRVP